jgi:hypothetical protein
MNKCYCDICGKPILTHTDRGQFSIPCRGKSFNLFKNTVVAKLDFSVFPLMISKDICLNCMKIIDNWQNDFFDKLKIEDNELFKRKIERCLKGDNNGCSEQNN